MDIYIYLSFYPQKWVCIYIHLFVSVYLSREVYSLALSSSSKDNQEHTYRKKEETKKLGSLCLLLQGRIHTREHAEHLWERELGNSKEVSGKRVMFWVGGCQGGCHFSSLSDLSSGVRQTKQTWGRLLWEQPAIRGGQGSNFCSCVETLQRNTMYLLLSMTHWKTVYILLETSLDDSHRAIFFSH